LIMIIGPCAMGVYKPRQNRKVAAVSKLVYVPRDNLVGVDAPAQIFKIEVEA